MSVFVIAEAGSNWHIGPDMDRNYRQALRLIQIAAEAGADACKFQVWSKDGVYLPGAGKWRGQDINELFNSLVLPKAWLPDLASECKKHKIEFMASVFSIDDAIAVDPFVKRHKIASYELGYEDLIRFCVGIGKPVIISTGAADHYEVEETRKWVGDKATFMQCSAVYPALVDEANIRAIDGSGISGYSDHTEDMGGIFAAMAIARGARVIEKHFTENRDAVGPDHTFALEPHELRIYVGIVRLADKAVGEWSKQVTRSEQALRKFAVRVVCARNEIKKGSLVRREDLVCMRPGSLGSGNDYYAHRLLCAVGKRAKIDIAAWAPIREGDLA